MRGLYDFITHPVLWMIVGTLVVTFFYYRMFGSTCPKCRERRALESTGGREPMTWTKHGRTELKCKYCGYTFWEKDPPGGV
jgi:hypothetical protein